MLIGALSVMLQYLSSGSPCFPRPPQSRVQAHDQALEKYAEEKKRYEAELEAEKLAEAAAAASSGAGGGTDNAAAAVSDANATAVVVVKGPDYSKEPTSRGLVACALLWRLEKLAEHYNPDADGAVAVSGNGCPVALPPGNEHVTFPVQLRRCVMKALRRMAMTGTTAAQSHACAPKPSTALIWRRHTACKPLLRRSCPWSCCCVGS